MEVELRPIRAQDSVEDLPPDENENDTGQGLDQGMANELEAYQGLQLDFESEFADFLSRDLPNSNNDNRSAGGNNATNNRPNVTADHLSNHRLEYNADGTVNCCDINYGSLCAITGRPSLDRLTSLTISVTSYSSSDNLSSLAYCTPGLTTLRLDNSRIQSLRVLGDELHRLRTLSVCYCGLEDLDGISYAPNIVSLCAADNHISDVYPITELRKIHTLDLENNDFEEYGSISFLFICPKLENLVLKGNPISYESEYRPTIFRILPGLKNLDVIMMKRVPRTFCKKDSKDGNEDDNFDSPSTNAIAVDIPKELEDVLDEPKKEPDPNPLEDQLIQTLINQKSDDEQTSQEDNEVIEADETAAEEIVKDEEDVAEVQDEDISKGDDSISVSLGGNSKSEEATSEDLFIPELATNADEQSVQAPVCPAEPVQHQPVIKDKVKDKEVSSASSYSKLLNRRKSLDPVRFREIRRELFGAEDFTLAASEADQPPAQPQQKKEPTTPTDPNAGFTPNLARMIKSSEKSQMAQKQRPDSSLSVSSSATNASTSYSHSISEADSGIGDIGPLASLKRPPAAAAMLLESSLPKLEARTGTGMKVTASCQLETPSKRTKKTDKAKLLRTNSDLSGKLTTEGDVEIEDFD